MHLYYELLDNFNFKFKYRKLIEAGFNLSYKRIEQKGMTLDHNFGYSFPLFSCLLKKREEEKDSE